jgi:hypothetical protein
MKNTRSDSELATHQTRKGHHNATNQHGVEPNHPKSSGSGELAKTAHNKDRVSKRHRKDNHASEHTAATAHRHATKRTLSQHRTSTTNRLIH